MLFLTSSRTVELASHDAVVRPDLSGQAVLHTGPVLPDVRVDTGGVVGVDVQLGKTDADSTEELASRYAYIAGQPEGQLAKIGHAVQAMAVDAAIRGAVLGLVPLAGLAADRPGPAPRAGSAGSAWRRRSSRWCS